MRITVEWKSLLIDAHVVQPHFASAVELLRDGEKAKAIKAGTVRFMACVQIRFQRIVVDRRSDSAAPFISPGIISQRPVMDRFPAGKRFYRLFAFCIGRPPRTAC